MLWVRGQRRVPLPGWSSNASAGALAINDQGAIAGYQIDGEQYTALLWAEGRPINLNLRLSPMSGWQLEEAVALNNRGQIAGVGRRGAGQRAFLLTPR